MEGVGLETRVGDPPVTGNFSARKQQLENAQLRMNGSEQAGKAGRQAWMVVRSRPPGGPPPCPHTTLPLQEDGCARPRGVLMAAPHHDGMFGSCPSHCLIRRGVD